LFEFDKAKPGAIRRQKTIGSLWDCQLPCFKQPYIGVIHMKVILMSFFVLFCIVFSGYAYSHWQNNLSNEYSGVIELSQTSRLETLKAPDGKHLVPEGVLMGKDDVNAIYYTYLLKTEDASNVNVRVENVYFIKNNVPTLDEDGLLHFEFTINQLTETRIEIHLTIRLNMPETEAQYNMIKESTVSFSLAFMH
jgi:hypothetical protein